MGDSTEWRDLEALPTLPPVAQAPKLKPGAAASEWVDVEEPAAVAPATQPSRPEVIDSIVKRAPMPEKVEQYLSTALALRAETAAPWENVFQQSKVINDSKNPEVKKLGTAIVDSAKSKIISNQIGQLGNKMMYAATPEAEAALMEEATKLEAELPKYEDVEPTFPPGLFGTLRKWGRKALTASTGFLTQQIDLAVGKGAQEKAAAFGKEEEFVAPTDLFSFSTMVLNLMVPSGLRQAFAIGTNPLAAMGEIEAGSAYIDLRRAGVDPAIAKPFAYGIGQINNILEMAEIATLVGKFPGVDKIFKTASDKLLEKVLVGPILKNVIVRAGAKAIVGAGEQLGQEFAQEAVTFYGENLTMEINDAIKGTELEKNADFQARLKQITEEALPGFLLMGAVPIAANVAVSAASKAKADATAKKALIAKTTEALAKAEAATPAAVREARAILAQPIEERDEAKVAAARKALDKTIESAIESPTEETVQAAAKAADLADQMDREWEDVHVRPAEAAAEAAAVTGAEAAREQGPAADRGAYREAPWNPAPASEGVGEGGLVAEAPAEAAAPAELPPVPEVPIEGTFPAIRTDDGSIYADTSGRTHVEIIKQLGIPPERVTSGGWVSDGDYSETDMSDTMRFAEQAKAKQRVEEKRTERVESRYGFELPTISEAEAAEWEQFRQELAGETPIDPAIVAKAWKPTVEAQTVLAGKHIDSTTPVLELDPETGAEQFHRSITQAKAEHKYGASVYVYPEEEYRNMRLFISPEGMTGAALKPDGDIVSGFNRAKRPGISSVGPMLITAIENGGTKLDCFDTVLPDLYADYGFVPVARMKWDDAFAPADWNKETFKDFNNGEPDVVWMVYSGGDRATIADRIGTFPEVEPESLPYSKTAEDAQAAQAKALTDIARRERLEAIENAKPKNQVRLAVEMGIPIDDAALFAQVDKECAREEMESREEIRDLANELEDAAEIVDADDFVDYMKSNEIPGFEKTDAWYEQQWEKRTARKETVSKERDDVFVAELEIGSLQATLRDIAANPNAEVGKQIAPFVRKSRAGITEKDFQDFARMAAKQPRKVREQIAFGLDPEGKTSAMAKRLEGVASKATKQINSDKNLAEFGGVTINSLAQMKADPKARAAARKVGTLARAAMRQPSAAIWYQQRDAIRDMQATVTLERGPKAREIRQRLRDFYKNHPELTPDPETKVILDERFIGDMTVDEFRDFADKIDQARRTGLDMKKMDDLKEAKIVEQARQGILLGTKTKQRFERGLDPYEHMEIRKHFVRRMMKLIPGATKDSVLAVMPLVDVYAKAEGKSTGTWIKDHIAGLTKGLPEGPSATVLEQQTEVQKSATGWLKQNKEPLLAGRKYIEHPAGKPKIRTRAVASWLEGDAQKLWERLGIDPGEALALDRKGQFKDQEAAKAVVDTMTDAIVYDIVSSLSQDGSGLGWYNRTVTQAIKKAAKIHPEILTDKNANTMWKLALAITSQGTKVDDNAINAHHAYEFYKQNGKWPGWVSFGGKDKKAITGNFQKIQDLYDKMVVEETHKLLNGKFTVREIEKALDITVSGENKDTEVFGSILLGPKIGGAFFSNLNKNFDELTMDLWFSRTMGRLKGEMFRYNEEHMKSDVLPNVRDAIRNDPSLTAKQRDTWIPLIDKLLDLPDGELTRETAAESEFAKVAAEIHKKYQKSKSATANTYGDKSDLNKAMKTADLWMNQTRDIPQSGGMRNLYRDIIRTSLAKLSEQGFDMNMADAQAILWYSEKDVFASFGKLDENDPDFDADEEEAYGGKRDYAQAADRLVRAFERNELGAGQVGEHAPKRGEVRRGGQIPLELESREGEAGRRGATRFEEDARATIEITKAADESTLGHEVAHVERRAIETMASAGDSNAIAMRAMLETQYGVENHNWTREQEERFADDQLSYMKEGNLPTPELESVFKDATALLADILSQAPREELGQGARFAFDMLFNPPQPEIDGSKYYQKLQMAGSFQADKLVKGIPWRRLQAQTLSPMRIFDMLGDAGKKSFDWMLDSREASVKRRRPIEKANADQARKLKIGRNLARKIKVPGAKNWFTAEEVIGMLWAKDNEDSHDTLIYGNQIPDKTVDALVAQLTPEEIAWGKIMHDQDQKLWAPMADAYEEATGHFAPPKVEDHFPIRLQDKAYESTASEMADDVLARGGIRKAAVSKKWFTKRKAISPEHRQKMRLDSTSLYFQQVEKTTHYIETWKTARRLDRIYNDPAVRDQISQVFGNDWNKAIESAINVFKNPAAFATVHPGDRFVNKMRRSLTASGLIGNLTSLGYQLTGPLMYLGDTGSQYLLRSLGQFTADPAGIWNKVMENLPLIESGSQDPVMAQLQNADASIRATVMNQITEWGFTPFDLIDKWTKVLGANAVYQKAIDAGLSETESWREAMRATLRTQPSGAEQDLPMMYHAQSMKLFLAFSRQLNQIWNMYTSDVPIAVRQGKLKRAAGDLMAIAATGFLIGMMQHKDLPEDPEEAAKWMAEQFLAAIPILGREAAPILLGEGFYGAGVEIIPGVGRMLQYGKNAITKSGRARWDAAIHTVIEATRFMNLPTVMINRAYNAIKDEDPWELIGGKPGER